MKHPLSFVSNGAGIALAFAGFVQLLLDQYHNPLLWAVLITAHATGIFALSVSLLSHSRRLSPETT